MRTISLSPLLAALLTAGLITACSPKFDWRDYRSADAPYAVLFPGKPSSHTRNINLDGQEVKMNMAAAEVDGTTFAVGSAELPDAAKAQAAIAAMKKAMVSNIGATVTSEKQADASASSNGVATRQTSIAIEAKGSRNGEPLLLVGRFVAKDKRVYQVIVVGREKHVEQEAVETFMSSFKLN
ncbi:MAG: hypothetical protein V4724_35910 [Pseudomonadota bacterium]